MLWVLWGFLGACEDLQHVPDVYLHRSLVVVLIRGLGLRNVEVNQSGLIPSLALPFRER